MAEAESGALSGAASGAAAGSVGGPIGMGIGAVIGGISGFLSGKARAKAAKAQNERLQRARALATPQHLLEVANAMQPMFRELVNAGLGPQFMQMVQDSLAKHSLTDTGVGEAMRTGAKAVPGVTASAMATKQAGAVVQNQIGAELGAPPIVPEENPLLSALQGGAQGYLSMKAAGGSRPISTPGIDPYAASFQSNGPEGLPNLTPENSRTQFPADYTPKVF